MLWHVSMYSNSLLSRSSVIDTNFKIMQEKKTTDVHQRVYYLSVVVRGKRHDPKQFMEESLLWLTVTEG